MVENSEFNIPVLIQDIDIEFQKLLKAKEDAFEKSVKACVAHGNIEARNITSNLKSEARNLYATMREDLLEEVRRGRGNIVIQTGETVSHNIRLENSDHAMFDIVAKSLVTLKKVLLVGPTGSGKTHMVGQIAERMGVPLHKYSCSRDSSVHDLIGYKQPTSEEYLNTSFLDCYENGGIFLVDEYDAMSGDMSLFFNGVTDSSPFISIPHRDAKPKAVKHKDFYLVFSGNTWGEGSVEYSGRDFQDKALLDRFRASKFFIDYNVEFEASLFEKLDATQIKAIRRIFNGYNSYISTRNFEDVATLVNSSLYRLEEAFEIIIQDFEPTVRARIKADIKLFLS